MITVWVFGDQLNRRIGALADADPTTHRVLFVQSAHKIASKAWHRQRLHFYLASMRRFATELEEAGFEVDYRVAPTMGEGLRQHVAVHRPSEVIATEPNSLNSRSLLGRLGVRTVRSNQFLCHPDDFTAFTTTRKSFKMEDFYRWQRKRLGYLMSGDEPEGGAWNFDADNRLPPPKNRTWPDPPLEELDDLDREVIADLPDDAWGASPTGWWSTSRSGALARLEHFVTTLLPDFGPYEDAMLHDDWHLAHSVLSPYLNNGLLLPGEVVERVIEAFRAGNVPINSVEGFVRQVIGWREFIWNMYWREMPAMRSANHLAAERPLPPMFLDPSRTQMRCMSRVLNDIHERAWVHHIPRLMILGNFALTSGIHPWQFTEWMWRSFVDAAEWVMAPNVMGMSLYADGGKVATKPYASGGAYIDKMSDFCKGCHFDRKARVGERACPYTTLYWDFLLRHQESFVRNPRIAQQVRAAQKLSDVDEVRARASDVLDVLDAGSL
ncbi:MAG: cryptochrome/photolyase family protein [Ilumatobacteraceae bacterium]